MNKLFAKGQEQYKKGDFEGAILSFSLAIERDPNNAEIYYERAMSYFHYGKSNLALIDLDKAVELQPNNPYRYSSRAYMRDAVGDIIGAINDYQKAIELDPEDAVCHNNLGLLQEKMGYIDEAKRHFSIADHLTNEKHTVSLHEPRPSGNVVKASVWSHIKKVFTDKDALREFLAFIRNGFKLKN